MEIVFLLDLPERFESQIKVNSEEYSTALTVNLRRLLNIDTKLNSTIAITFNKNNDISLEVKNADHVSVGNKTIDAKTMSGLMIGTIMTMEYVLSKDKDTLKFDYVGAVQ